METMGEKRGMEKTADKVEYNKQKKAELNSYGISQNREDEMLIRNPISRG